MSNPHKIAVPVQTDSIEVSRHEIRSANKVRKMYQFMAVIIATAFISSGVTLTIAADGPTGFGTVIEPGSMVEDANYIIFKDNSNYYAKNGASGVIAFSGTNATSIIQSAINDSMPYGSVYLKPNDGDATLSLDWEQHIDFVLDWPIFLPIGISLYGDSTWIDGTGLDQSFIVVNPDSVLEGADGRSQTIAGINLAGLMSNVNAIGVEVRQQAFGLTLENMHIKNCYIGIKLTDAAYRFSIRDCWIQSSSGAGYVGVGIQLATTATEYPNAGVIDHVDIGWYGVGIYHPGGSQLVVTDCWLEANNHTIETYGSLTVTNSYIHPPIGGTGIIHSGAIAGGLRVDSCNIIADGVGAIGINCTANNQNRISNTYFSMASGGIGIGTGISAVNVFMSTCHSNADGSSGSSTINGRFDRSTFSANSFSGNPAISLVKGGGVCSYNILDGNKFIPQSGCTHLIYAGSYNIISNNVFEGGSVNINQTSGTYNAILGNFLTGSTPIILYGGSSTSLDANIGYATENKGTATITATTFVIFNHGLATTPTLVLASFSLASYGNYTWTATTTQITITVSTSGTYTVYWYAEV
jgi:hypothetical protein